jgi:hypothetical protein
MCSISKVLSTLYWYGQEAAQYIPMQSKFTKHIQMPEVDVLRNPLCAHVLGQSKVLLNVKTTRQNESVALSFHCVLKHGLLPFTIKLIPIAGTNNVHFYVTKASLLRAKGVECSTFEHPINQRLLDYITKMLRGSPCGVLTPSGEETGSIALAEGMPISLYARVHE